MITAIIPARANSQRIPGKNMKPLDGKPLLFYTLSAALRCPLIDLVVLSTESSNIIHQAREYVDGAFPGSKFLALKHPLAYSASEVQTDTIFTYALWETKLQTGVIPDILVLLAPTSPLRTAKHIEEAINIYNNLDNIGCLVGVVRDKKFHWGLESGVYEITPVQHDPAWRAGSQWISEDDWLFVENGSIYIVDAAEFGSKRNYRIPPYVPYIMPEETALELDTLLDWSIMESIMRVNRSELLPILP